MKYQKIINLLDHTTNQLSKFRTKSWVEINDESRGNYNDDGENNNNIKFKTSMIKSSLCDYSDAYILVKGIISAPSRGAQRAAVFNTNKKVVFKSCAPFTSCITEINNTQVDYAEGIDIGKSMYILIEYSNAYSNISGNTW